MADNLDGTFEEARSISPNLLPYRITLMGSDGSTRDLHAFALSEFDAVFQGYRDGTIKESEDVLSVSRFYQEDEEEDSDHDRLCDEAFDAAMSYKQYGDSA